MKRLALVVILTLLEGCVSHSGPKGNQDFYPISQQAELAGVYKNKGDPIGFLSGVIWGYTTPKTSTLGSHEAIEFIEVSSTEKSLTAKAIQNGCVVYEKSYVVGRDIKIDAGKIVIDSNLSLLSRGSGDVLVGPVYDKITLGLDAGKNGKLRQSSYSAGLVFLLLPVAASDTHDIRFERVADKPQGFPACNSR